MRCSQSSSLENVRQTIRQLPTSSHTKKHLDTPIGKTRPLAAAAHQTRHQMLCGTSVRTPLRGCGRSLRGLAATKQCGRDVNAQVGAIRIDSMPLNWSFISWHYPGGERPRRPAGRRASGPYRSRISRCVVVRGHFGTAPTGRTLAQRMVALRYPQAGALRARTEVAPFAGAKAERAPALRYPQQVVLISTPSPLNCVYGSCSMQVFITFMPMAS